MFWEEVYQACKMTAGIPHYSWGILGSWVDPSTLKVNTKRDLRAEIVRVLVLKREELGVIIEVGFSRKFPSLLPLALTAEYLVLSSCGT